MKLSISKLALFVGTPVLLLGFQNCAKLGTENLLGGSSSFVTSGSTEIASTRSPASTSTNAPLVNAWKTCHETESLKSDPNGEFVVESCLNLFCQSKTTAVSSESKKEAMCTALVEVQKSYTM